MRMTGRPEQRRPARQRPARARGRRPLSRRRWGRPVLPMCSPVAAQLGGPWPARPAHRPTMP
eukprot:8834487-Alexandrium_andersonii.AAC.1